MRTPTLKTMRLRNFKGVERFDLTTNGLDAEIRGDNGAGKTSLVDAWNWALFGLAPFEIKTLDAAGQAKSGLEHQVEVTLDVAGREVTFGRAYREKWVKKRGSTTAEFSGHETDYQVDGVPVSKGDYDERVARILDTSTFRLLTDAGHFNALPWKERRQVLLDVCGDVTDADVIAKDPELCDLPGILDGRSMDDYRKIVDARRRKINEELKQLPARVDELTLSLADRPAGSRADVEARLAAARDHRSGLQERLARLSAGGEVAERQVSLREIEGKIHDVARSVTAGAEEALAAARRERARLEDDASRARRALAQAEQDRDTAQRRRETLVDELATLRGRWAEINDRTPPHATTPESCPACGQALPADQITAAHSRALEEWNARQAADLEAVQARGQAGRRDLDALTASIGDLHEAVAAAGDEVARARAAEVAATARVDDLTHAVPDPTTDPEHQTLTGRKAALQAEIAALRADGAHAEAALRAELAVADDQIAQLQRDASNFDVHAKTEERITALRSDEKRLAGEFEALERHIHLMERFTRAKVDALTDRINNRFALARFKLFDNLVNGAVVEACETTYEGVPFGSLNHGARVNVSLDIIRTLQEHYGSHPPVWVDGRESVTRLVDMPCQVLSLVVDARYPTLSVELDAPQEVAA